MDKQIIIDGVDVTDCEYCSRYADTTIYHCDWTGECKEHPNCYYKQLKRKEQECEMWKNLTVDNGAVALNYQKTIDQLKAENEELKHEYWELEQGNDFLAEKNSKLKGCLTEIKEIAEANKKYIYVLPSYFVAGDSLEFSFGFIKKHPKQNQRMRGEK